jgi:hypothetical protein
MATDSADTNDDDSEVDPDYVEALQGLARREYGSKNINIDSDADISEGNDGTWVQAWVFLSNDTLRENGLPTLTD